MAKSEAAVWALLDDDAIRAVATFLPMIPLTPKGVWHLTAVNKGTRRALKAWLEGFKTKVEDAMDFCQKIGMPPKDVNTAVRLHLYARRIGEKGMLSFSSLIASGSLGRLTLLVLLRNQIGDTGLTALATAIGSGVLGKLERLWIDKPSQSLRDTCSARNIKLNTWA